MCFRAEVVDGERVCRVKAFMVINGVEIRLRLAAVLESVGQVGVADNGIIRALLDLLY